MRSSDRPTPSHELIANELTVTLCGILFWTLVLTAPIVLFAAVGPIALVAAGLVLILAFRFALRAVFAALDELLEAKFAELDRRSEPHD